MLIWTSWIALAAAVSLTLSAEASAQTRIVMIGDSITLGVVSSGLPTVGPAYPAQVDTMMGDDFEVHVAACGLTISRHWRPNSGIPRFCQGSVNLYSQMVQAHLPFTMATILLGTNDAIWEGGTIPPFLYGVYIGEIIDGLFDDGIEKVVLMVAPQLPETFPVGATDTIWDYRDEIFALCQPSGDDVHCGPDLAVLLDPEDHFDPVTPPYVGQDIHPNALGHDIIADALYPVLMAVPEPGSELSMLSALVTLGLLARKRSVVVKRI